MKYIDRIFHDDKTPVIKYLRVFFNPICNFKFHIQSILSKLSKAIIILSRVKHFLRATALKHFLPAAALKHFLPAAALKTFPIGDSALKTLYFSLFHCHLIYAAEIWGCAAKNLPTVTPIFLKQKQAIRILSSKKYNTHTEPLFKKN